MVGRRSLDFAAAHLHPAVSFPSRERIRVFQQSGPDEWGSHPGSSTPVSPVLALVGFVGLCLLVSAVDGTLTSRAIHGWYLSLVAPPGTPPNWVFAPIWSALYVS